MGRKKSRKPSRAAKKSSPVIQEPADQPAPETAAPSSWIQGLDRVVRMTSGELSPRVRTSLICHVRDDHRSLYLPPEMPALQPRSLSYLSAFAMRNDFQMVEDRRQVHVSPVIEQRNGKPPAAALGLALLMKQTGLPGPAATLSYPHRLDDGNPIIDLPELIAIAAHAAPSAKRIVTLPNEPLVDVLDNDTLPISGFGCVTNTDKTSTVLSHFEGDNLHCIGYSTGGQYVMHLLLGGGPLTSPTLWTHPHTLTRTEIRFRLFLGHKQANDFGLLHSTFYYDMAERSSPPWWLDDSSPLAHAIAS